MVFRLPLTCLTSDGKCSGINAKTRRGGVKVLRTSLSFIAPGCTFENSWLCPAAFMSPRMVPM